MCRLACHTASDRHCPHGLAQVRACSIVAVVASQTARESGCSLDKSGDRQEKTLQVWIKPVLLPIKGSLHRQASEERTERIECLHKCVKRLLEYLLSRHVVPRTIDHFQTVLVADVEQRTKPTGSCRHMLIDYTREAAVCQ